MKIITPAQCRAARGLLNWSQTDLANAAHVTQRTIASFELGERQPSLKTYTDMLEAFEGAGIRFIEPEDGATGQGVAFRWGVEPPTKRGGDASDVVNTGGAGTVALPEVADALRPLYDYWRERKGEWLAMSDPCRRAVLREIYGFTPEFDPIGAATQETSFGKHDHA